MALISILQDTSAAHTATHNDACRRALATDKAYGVPEVPCLASLRSGAPADGRG